VNVTEAIAWLGTLPPDAQVDVTVRPPSSLDELFRPMTSAERMRALRERRRKGVTPSDAVSSRGGKGGICLGSEKETQKQGKESEDLGSNLTGSTGGDVTKSDECASHLVTQVFEFWRTETSHARAVLDRKRASRIASRLREGFTAERLCVAIANRRNDPFLMGSNDTGRVFDGIETLLRDAAQVERLEKLTAPLVAHARAGFKSAGTLLMERSARIAAEEGQQIPVFPLLGGSR